MMQGTEKSCYGLPLSLTITVLLLRFRFRALLKIRLLTVSYPPLFGASLLRKEPKNHNMSALYLLPSPFSCCIFLFWHF